MTIHPSRVSLTCAAIAALVLSAGAGRAQTASSMNTSAAGAPASAMDKKFVSKSMQDGMAEVQLGQLASQKASSQDVKDFGQKMVDDHTKLNDQMKPIAMQLGITPPDSVSPKDQALMTRLQALNGPAFDKAYVNAMVADHKEDDKEFKAEAAKGTNPQVKDAASQGETVISTHLQMVESLQSKVK